MVEYRIGQKFHDEKLSETERSNINTWCNENNCCFYGIRQNGLLTRYIVNNLNNEDLAEFDKCANIVRINNEWFSNNDYKHNKYIRGEYTEEAWNEIKLEFDARSKATTDARNYMINILKKNTNIDEEYSN